MERLSRSKLFKTDKNKILDCIIGPKSQFKKKRFFKANLRVTILLLKSDITLENNVTLKL